MNSWKAFVRRTAGPAMGQARCLLWDWRHAVETCGNRQPRAETVLPSAIGAFEHARMYMPTHPRLVHRILAGLPLNGHRYDFVDFGSGKGRVVLVASEYPLGSVTGIEFDRELHQIAERNIARYRGTQRCQAVQSVCMDVREFRMEPRESIFFFYSPFGQPVMEAVLDAIQGSLRENPRDCFLVYVNPEHPGLVSARGAFELYARDAYCCIWRSSRRVSAS